MLDTLSAPYFYHQPLTTWTAESRGCSSRGSPAWETFIQDFPLAAADKEIHYLAANSHLAAKTNGLRTFCRSADS